MPKDQTSKKKPRHLTCSKCLKPPKWLIESRGAVPRTIEFPTSDGLDKHLHAEHRSLMYSCNAVGCFKGTSAPKFQKSETLTQHIKESHKPNALFSCPVRICSFEPSKLDDIAIHAYWVHRDLPSRVYPRISQRKDHNASVDAVINAASWQYFRCPIWNCRKFISSGHKKVSAHLLAHLPILSESVQDKLANDGYEIHFAPSDVTPSAAARHTISIQIRCPACEVRCKNDAGFRQHIETAHMLARIPGMLEHFEQWRENVLSWSTKEYHDQIFHRPCWLERGGVRSDFSSGREAQKCSYSTCTFIWEEGRCHPSFLRPVEEIDTDLWLHRIEILRHYPQFITYPMFEFQE
jgi:hypothetical protein